MVGEDWGLRVWGGCAIGAMFRAWRGCVREKRGGMLVDGFWMGGLVDGDGMG